MVHRYLYTMYNVVQKTTLFGLNMHRTQLHVSNTGETKDLEVQSRLNRQFKYCYSSYFNVCYFGGAENRS